MIRPAGAQDARFLRDMLRHAYFWRMSGDADLPLYRYVANWGRRGDFGLVAIDDAKNLVGAAWYRLFRPAEPGFGFVDEQTPELTIAVVPSRRGQGFGRELLDGLLAAARERGFERISLSTDPSAAAMYSRYGFREVADGDDAVTMVASLGSNRGS
jgi:ribosomal protein S18 acetylase RimI-like enzyme